MKKIQENLLQGHITSKDERKDSRPDNKSREIKPLISL